MRRTIRHVLAFSLGGLLLTSAAAQEQEASEIDALHRELDQLRQEYEDRLLQLEQRLQAAEQAQEPDPSDSHPVDTPSLPNVGQAVERSSRAQAFADQEFEQRTESREIALAADPEAPLRDRIEAILHDFVEFGGYFRAGYGRNDQGGPQVGFGAPGALAKYRLGNEAENYGELMLGKSWYVPGMFALDPKERPNGTPSGPIARFQLRMAFFNPYQDFAQGSGTDVSLPEAWASIGNVVAGQPSLKFWAGNRFYRRHDIHINDFFFYNMSGGGGGLEDLTLPFGKLALAWIGFGQRSGFSSLPEPDAENQAGFSKQNWDLRLYEVPLPLGEGEFGLAYVSSESGRDVLGNTAPRTDGFALNFVHTRNRFLGEDGYNKLSLQFGTGPAKTFTTGFETLSLTHGLFIRPDTRDSWRIRATEHFVANLSDQLSISPALVYQLTDYGDVDALQHWFSAGVRPIWHLNRYLSLAFETGVDWVKDEATGRSDALGKMTLAPQVSLGKHFMSRPVIRAYATYAFWGDEFSGEVGGQDYANQHHGWGFGAQMETWW